MALIEKLAKLHSKLKRVLLHVDSLVIKTQQTSDSNFTERDIIQIDKKLNETISNKTGLETLICHICTKRFEKVVDLRQHKCIRKCPACDYQWYNRNELCLHVRQNHGIHSPLGPYACPLCLKTFDRADKLNSHKNVHKQTKTYVCNYNRCMETFNERFYLMQHIVKRHSETNEQLTKNKLICNICGKSFRRKSNIIKHLKTHEEIVDYVMSDDDELEENVEYLEEELL